MNNTLSPHLLISGFEPFENRSENQSFQVLRALQKAGYQTVSLPVLFRKAFETLKASIETNNPSVILSLGEGSEPIPRLEHFALNMMHARIPDNHGFIPELTLIQPRGKTTLTSTVPIDELASYLDEKKVLYRHSFHAGTYVCNDLYYRTLMEYGHKVVVFVHVSHDPKDFLESLATVQAIVDFFTQKKNQ
jgi:pyroglutamyl-peptidase